MKSYAPPSEGWSTYINYLKFFTCVFIYLFIWTHGYLFSALCYKPVILYFVVKLSHHWPWLLCSFDILPTTWCFWALPYFLALKDVPGSSVIFAVTALEWAIFFIDLLFLLLENGIRNQDLGSRYVCYWGVFASKPSQLIEQENICVYTSSYM